jgi:hypothetical protein
MLRLLLPLLALPLIAASGCAPRPHSPMTTQAAALAPDTYALERGQRAELPRDTRLVFVEVVEDGRCPVDVECVWIGRATARFTVAIGTATETLDLTIPGGVSPLEHELQPVEAHGFRFTLRSLRPYPGVRTEADRPLTAVVEAVPLTGAR